MTSRQGDGAGNEGWSKFKDKKECSRKLWDAVYKVDNEVNWKVDEVDPSIRIPKPKKLTQYLDTVELSLLNQVCSKSDSFFRETNRFSYLKSLVADLVDEVKLLRAQLDQIHERNITEVELIPVMDKRRKDIKILGQVLIVVQ